MRVRKHETKIGKTFARDEEDTWAQSGGRKDLADGRKREGLVTSGKIFWINSPAAPKVAVGTWDSPLLGLARDPPRPHRTSRALFHPIKFVRQYLKLTGLHAVPMLHCSKKYLVCQLAA